MITIANNEHTEGIVVGEFVLSVVDAQVTVQGKEILYSSLRGQRDLPAGWCSPNAVRVHNPQKQNLISFLQTKSQNLNIVLFSPVALTFLSSRTPFTAPKAAADPFALLTSLRIH